MVNVIITINNSFFDQSVLDLHPLMSKKISTIFFLLVFLIPVLPLRQVGELLAGATMTEELPETGSSKSAANFMDAKLFLHSANHGNGSGFNVTGGFQYIHFSETLPFHLASDVQTPPPNIFC